MVADASNADSLTTCFVNQLAYITVDAVQMFVQDLWACGLYMKDEM